MQNINSRQGQNIFDVAIWQYGSAEGVIKLLQDNPNLSLTSVLVAGQSLTIIQDPDRKEIVDYYSKFNHIVTSGTDG